MQDQRLKTEDRRLEQVTRFRSLLFRSFVFGLWSLAGLSGCGLDMKDNSKYKPLEPAPFFEDGRSSRPLIEGTVARGTLPTDEVFETGRKDGKLVEELPTPLTPQLLARGRERFNIYCSVCHDQLGTGNGIVVQRGLRPPPSFHIARLKEAPMGHFFDVITHGFGAMSDYSAQVVPADRWAIAAYIRALQLSQHAPLSDVAEDKKPLLDLSADQQTEVAAESHHEH